MKKAALIILAWAMLACLQPAWAADKHTDKCGHTPHLQPGMREAMMGAQKLMAKQPAQAARLLADYAAKNPKEHHFKFSFLRGVIAYQAKDLKQADRFFSRSVELWPCHTPSLTNLAVVKYELKQPLAAAELMKKAYDNSQKPKPGYLFQAAAFYLAAEKPALALPILEKLAKLPKAKPAWLKALVRTHMELKQYQKAKAILARLLKMTPGDADLWKLSARLNMNKNDYAKAAADLEVAYRIKAPSTPSAWRTLAGIYRMAGVPKKAALFYARAFGDTPRPRDLDALAGVYLEGNYLEPALQTGLRAIRLKPSAKRWRVVGQIYMMQRNYASALEAFKKAAALSPKGGRLHLLAGYCALQMEKYQQALGEFEIALRLAKPKGRTAREAGRILNSVRAYLKSVKEANKG